MNEKSLLKVALVCSVVGIIIIFIFADKLEPDIINISDISNSFVDKNVKIQGKIVSIKSTPSVLILDVKDNTGSIKTIAYDNDLLDFNEGQSVEVIGLVKEYKGILEIEAKKINTLNNE